MIREGFVTDRAELGKRARALDLPVEAALAREIAAELKQRMDAMNKEGVGCLGLAAPQIGVPLRIFVLRDFQPPVLNPELAHMGDRGRWMNEGCFSVPDTLVPVERATEIRLRYRTFEGEWREALFRGIDARAAQHELDHLDGTLIVDHLVPA